MKVSLVEAKKPTKYEKYIASVRECQFSTIVWNIFIHYFV